MSLLKKHFLLLKCIFKKNIKMSNLSHSSNFVLVPSTQVLNLIMESKIKAG